MYISYTTFGMDPNNRNGKIENLNVSDLYQNRAPIDYNNFRQNTGIEINIESYRNIMQSINRAKLRLTGRDE